MQDKTWQWYRQTILDENIRQEIFIAYVLTG